MTEVQMIRRLLAGQTSAAVEEALSEFLAENRGQVSWEPLGRDNNRGPIESGGDPGRALLERITNAFDAVLELEFVRHNGIPECRSSREAATAWLGVDARGLYQLSQAERQRLANRVLMTIHEGDGRGRRTVDIQDFGIGIAADQMPATILSLNESNKLEKFYLAGAYGQGGSSTYTASRFTVIASRSALTRDAPVAFTVVRFEDLPPDRYKHGRYVYMQIDGRIPRAELPLEEFPCGTLVRHYGYDISAYPSPLGPNSIYGLAQHVLFDPIMPFWLEDRPHRYRRVIKGSRNALSGAVDPGDERARVPELAHHVPQYYVTLGDFGNLGVEYWVLSRGDQQNKRPNAAFVNPSRPIVLTLHGQSHGELSASLIRKDAELPFLTSRLILHLDCNNLSPLAKRTLFVANREEARSGEALRAIQDEIVRGLRSDDDLRRLNEEARTEGLRERDEEADRRLRTEVARVLRTFGLEAAEPIGGTPRGDATSQQPARPGRGRRTRPQLIPIESHDPPTFVEFSGDPPISFYPGQRRYLRVRTDAPSYYHSPDNPGRSRFNLIVGSPLRSAGSTSLVGGRVRFVVEGLESARVGDDGEIRLELTRPGLEHLQTQIAFTVVEAPAPPPTGVRITLPQFDVTAVSGPEDPRWISLGWPDDTSLIASSSEQEGGRIGIYYSEAFPPFRDTLNRLEQRDIHLSRSFRNRYEMWIAVHSLLLEQAKASDGSSAHGQTSEQHREEADRQERCRTARLASMFAYREVQEGLTTDRTEDAE